MIREIEWAFFFAEFAFPEHAPRLRELREQLADVWSVGCLAAFVNIYALQYSWLRLHGEKPVLFTGGGQGR